MRLNRVKNVDDSYAPLVMGMEIGNRDGFMPVPVHDYFQSLQITFPSEASWTGTLELFDAEDDYLESLLLVSGVNRRVRLQWGWDLPGVSLSQYPVVESMAVRYTPSFTPQGTGISLELVTGSLIEQAMDKRSRSFPKGLTASEIVRAIATDRGWKTHDDTGRTTIEDTVGKMADEVIQHNESDLRFILDVLLKEATNAENESYVVFFDAQDVFHFHSHNWISRQSRRAAKTYRFARGSVGEDVMEFSPDDAIPFSVVSGGAAARHEGADSEDGQKVSTASTSTAGPDGQSAPKDSDARHQPNVGDGVGAIIPIVARDRDTLTRQAKVHYDQLRKFSFKANLTARGTHEVVPQDYIAVEYLKRNGAAHYLSGVFRVFSVTHNIGDNGWDVQMELHREGTHKVPGADQTVSEGRKRDIDPQGEAKTANKESHRVRTGA